MTIRVLTAVNEVQLDADIARVNAAASGAYDIRIGANIAETADPTAIALRSGVRLTIDGSNRGGVYALAGASAHRGLFVYSGVVTIENLAIQNARATGAVGFAGMGGAAPTGGGGGGGGGAGLGGGVFVGKAASVWIANVSFSHDAAIGGRGGWGGGISGSGGSGGFGGHGVAGGGGGGPGAPGGFGGGGGGGDGGAPATQTSGGGGGGWGGGGGGGGGGVGAITGVSTFGSGGAGGAAGFGAGHGGAGGAGLPGGVFAGSAGSGGFGGGGGGGLGAGGDVFVQQGGSLHIEGGRMTNGYVKGGLGVDGGQNGVGVGGGLFLQGNQSVTFGAGQTKGEKTIIAGVIADQTGSGGVGPYAGAGRVVVAGAGAVELFAANHYTGGTSVIGGGTLVLGSVASAGSGAISLVGRGGRVDLMAGFALANVIRGYSGGDAVEFGSVAYAAGDKAVDANGAVSIETARGAVVASFKVAGRFASSNFHVGADTLGHILVTYVPSPALAPHQDLARAALPVAGTSGLGGLAAAPWSPSG